MHSSMCVATAARGLPGGIGGNLGVFICPYHACAYNLNGSLRAARDMPPEFDFAALGLKEIDIRLVEGLDLHLLRRYAA